MSCRVTAAQELKAKICKYLSAAEYGKVKGTKHIWWERILRPDPAKKIVRKS